MREGDWVLCVFESRYRYVAQVLGKYKNEAFAEAIWGRDPAGRTWSLVYFLSRPVAIDVPVEALGGSLNASYMGFFRISDEKVDQIEQVFGSLDEYIKKELLFGNAFVEIPDGISRDDVLQAIGDFGAGVSHEFADSTKYDLIHEGRRYPPKAIIGLAARRVLGRALRPSEFSGGESSNDRPASFGPDLMSVRQRSESLRFCHSSSSVPRSSRVLAAGSPERCAA